MGERRRERRCGRRTTFAVMCFPPRPTSLTTCTRRHASRLDKLDEITTIQEEKWRNKAKKG